MAEKQILLILYVFAGLLLTGLSIPLILEKIKPNPLYGFRVPKTFGDPGIWYAANKFAGKRLFWSGLGMVIGSIVLYFVPNLSLDAYALGSLAIFSVVFVIGIVQSFVYLIKL